MQASIDARKYSIGANKEDFYGKMKKLRYTIASIFYKLIVNVDHVFHQYQNSSQDVHVEDYGLSEIANSTSETKPSKYDSSSFRKPT